MSRTAHLLVLAMTLLTLAFIVRLLRRGHLRAKYSLLWLSLGVVLAVLAASPQILDRVSIALGISYGPATFFFGAIFLLFLVVIHFSYELSRLEERTRSLAEEIALLRAELEAPSAEIGDGRGPAIASGPDESSGG